MAEQSPLERAARALSEANGVDPDYIDEGADEPYWKCLVEDARAVLMAVREPSEAMLPDPHNTDTALYRAARLMEDESVSTAEAAAAMWQAMIDAALNETA